MNQEFFDHMRKQMTPSPQVRAELSEKLARAAKKRPAPWKRYGAVAACTALVIGAFSIYSLYQDHEKWALITQNFHRDDLVQTQRLHSYVTVEGETGTIQENAAVTEPGGGDTGAPNTGALPALNTGDLPGGAYVGDISVQEEAVAAYEKLMAHFDGTYPDWYGGAYIDDSGWLVVQLVEDKDPGGKSLELQVLDWTGSDSVMFSSCKYSLGYLRTLQDKVVDAMSELGLFSTCGADEERNRLDLTLTSVTDEALALLAELDPDDDAIYVQVGQRASTGEDTRTDSAKTEEPAVSYVIQPGAAVREDDDNLIADEPVYDGAHYDVENLPEELPEEKRPAMEVQSASKGTASADTPSYTPEG